MGSWRAELRWDHGRRRDTQQPHKDYGVCNALATECDRVVEQHQRWQKPEDGDVPEFTIEVAYKTHDQVGNTVTPGWRYVLKWLENGEAKQMRNYGFISKDNALYDAKYTASEIAKSLRPVHIETYTPEV